MVYVPTGEFLVGSTDEQVDAVLELCRDQHPDCARQWFEDEQPAQLPPP